MSQNNALKVMGEEKRPATALQKDYITKHRAEQLSRANLSIAFCFDSLYPMKAAVVFSPSPALQPDVHENY